MSVVARLLGSKRARALQTRPHIVGCHGGGGIGLCEDYLRQLTAMAGAGKREAERRGGSLLRIATQPPAQVVSEPTMAVGAVDSDELMVRRAEHVFPPMASQLGAAYRVLRLPTKSTAKQNAPAMYKRLLDNENGSLDALTAWERSLVEAVGPDRVEMNIRMCSVAGTGSATFHATVERIDPQLIKKPVFNLVVAIRPDVTKIQDPINYVNSIAWSLEKTQELMENGRLDTVVMVANEVAPAVKLALANPDSLLQRLADAVRTGYENPFDAASASKYFATMARLSRLEVEQANDLVVKAIEPITMDLVAGHVLGHVLRMAQGGPTDTYNVQEQLKQSWVTPSYLPDNMAATVEEAIEKLLVTALAPHELWAAGRVIIVVGSETAKRLGVKGPALVDEIQSVLYDNGYTGRLAVLTVANTKGWWMYIAHRKPPVLYTMETITDALKSLRKI